MDYRSRSQAASEYLKRHEGKPYTPHFNAGLLRVMADAKASTVERVLAWAIRCAGGNSSDYAVANWDDLTPIGQRACALDLAFLESGRKFHELGTLRKRAAADPSVVPSCVRSKADVSRAFAKNRRRGTIECRGHKIIPVTGPITDEPDSPSPSSDTAGLMVWWREHRPDRFAVYEDISRLCQELSKRKLEMLNEVRREYQEVTDVGTFADQALETSDGPSLLKKKDLKKKDISSSSLEEGPTTTGSATDAVPAHAAPDCPTSPEQRIAPDPDDRRDTVSAASVRPSDRTERKRALPRPPQRPSKNGGDRPDGGSRRADAPTGNLQNSTVLRDPVHCPPVVAEAVENAGLGLPDQNYCDGLWAACVAVAPDVKPDEVVRCINQKAHISRTKGHNPFGLLWSSVVKVVATPASLAKMRRDLAAMDAARAEQEQRAEHARLEAEAYIRKCQDESS